MDCFVASAPRNDVDSVAPHNAVVPRVGGGSSTPRLFGSIISALEYWAAWLNRAMTPDVCSHSRDALRPRLTSNFATSGNQMAQGMPDARCTRGLMRNVHRKCAHEHTR